MLKVLPIEWVTPTQAIIAAGVGAVLMNGGADKAIVAAGIKALYGNGVGYAS